MKTTARMIGSGWSGRLQALAVLLALFSGPSAQATTVLKVDLAQMTTTSEWVVRAHVTAVTNVDLRPQGLGLNTDVTFAIDETYRGANVPATYTMRMMGGVGADGMALTIPGMPRFKVGEEVVVFLEKTAVGHVPCGLGQGVWRVLRTPAGPTLVRQSIHGLHLMARSPSGAIVPTHDEGGARTLERLAADIRAVPAAPNAPLPNAPGTLAPSPR